MANSFIDSSLQANVDTILPPIASFMDMKDYVPCNYCSHMFANPQQLRSHQSQCRVRATAPPPSGQGFSRHDSIHSVHSINGTPGGPLVLNSITTQFPPSPSSVASESDSAEMAFTPNSSRASSVSRSYQESRRTSRTENKMTKRNRRNSPVAIMAQHDKKAKKTAKEKLNRGNQAAVMTRMEDALQHYCGWERIEQSGGNGNSAGLTSCKINLLRAAEAVDLFVLHEARCAAIRSGTLAEFERRGQQVAEDALKPGCQPGNNTFMELPPGEQPCRHEDTKSKQCSVHGHPDWRECRKTRMAAIFRHNEDAYIASLGMTRQQAMYGTRAAPMQARLNVLPHRQSRH